jgi:altronate hydrolase
MLTEHVLVIQLNRSDDVVIACQDVPAGTVLDEYGLTVRDAVPAGHKIALRSITSGQPVRRYDQIIGFASEPIAAGQHVHVHNLRVQFSNVITPSVRTPSQPGTFNRVQPSAESSVLMGG